MLTNQELNQQQMQPNQQQINNRGPFATKRSLLVPSISTGLAVSGGLIFAKAMGASFSLIPGLSFLTSTFVIGGAVAAGVCFLLPLSVSLIKKIREKRREKKAIRNSQIATRKAFFEKMGYEIPNKPKWKGGFFGRIGSFIASKFSKKQKAKYEAKKAKYEEEMKEYKAGKKLLEKTPWVKANINSSLINPNYDENTEQLVMVDSKPIIKKDKDGNEETYWKVVSVYPNAQGEKVHIIKDDVLFATNKKTSKPNCEFLTMSDEDFNKRLEDNLIVQKISSPAATAVDPLLQPTQGSTSPTTTATAKQSPKVETKKEDTEKDSTQKLELPQSAAAAPTSQEMNNLWIRFLSLILPNIIELLNKDPQLVSRLLESQKNNAELIELAKILGSQNLQTITNENIEAAQANLGAQKVVQNDEKTQSNQKIIKKK